MWCWAMSEFLAVSWGSVSCYLLWRVSYDLILRWEGDFERICVVDGWCEKCLLVAWWFLTWWVACVVAVTPQGGVEWFGWIDGLRVRCESGSFHVYCLQGRFLLDFSVSVWRCSLPLERVVAVLLLYEFEWTRPLCHSQFIDRCVLWDVLCRMIYVLRRSDHSTSGLILESWLGLHLGWSLPCCFAIDLCLIQSLFIIILMDGHFESIEKKKTKKLQALYCGPLRQGIWCFLVEWILHYCTWCIVKCALVTGISYHNSFAEDLLSGIRSTIWNLEGTSRRVSIATCLDS